MEYQFKIPECKKVLIEFSKHANDKKPSKVKEIIDKEIIDKIRTLLKEMPEKGDMFVSFTSEISYTKVIFFCGKEEYYFHIYGDRIQILDTTFLVGDSELEKELVDYINKLLN